MTTRFSPIARRLVLASTALLITLTSVAVAASPADAVSSWSGKDPFQTYNGTTCAAGADRFDATPVYAESTFVGTGYLVYSPTCKTNWGEFWYASDYTWENYEVDPSAWEAGTSNTNQYSPNLNDEEPVYTLMVDGRSTACAGGQLYHYGPKYWITWYTYGCA